MGRKFFILFCSIIFLTIPLFAIDGVANEDIRSLELLMDMMGGKIGDFQERIVTAETLWKSSEMFVNDKISGFEEKINKYEVKLDTLQSDFEAFVSSRIEEIKVEVASLSGSLKEISEEKIPGLNEVILKMEAMVAEVSYDLSAVKDDLSKKVGAEIVEKVTSIEEMVSDIKKEVAENLLEFLKEKEISAKSLEETNLNLSDLKEKFINFESNLEILKKDFEAFVATGIQEIKEEISGLSKTLKEIYEENIPGLSEMISKMESSISDINSELTALKEELSMKTGAEIVDRIASVEEMVSDIKAEVAENLQAFLKEQVFLKEAEANVKSLEELKEETKSSLAGIMEMVQKIENDLSLLNRDLEVKLNDKFEALKVEILNLTAELELVGEKAVPELNEGLKDLAGKTENLLGQFEALKIQVTEKAENSEVDLKVSEIQESVSGVREEVEELLSSFLQQKELSSAFIQETNKVIADMQDQSWGINKRLVWAEAALSKLKAGLNSLEESSNGKIDNEIVSVKKEISSINTKLEDSAVSRAFMAESIIRLAGQISDLNGEVDSSKVQEEVNEAAMESRITDLNERIVELIWGTNKRVKWLESSSAVIKTDVKKLYSDIHEVNAALEEKTVSLENKISSNAWVLNRRIGWLDSETGT